MSFDDFESSPYSGRPVELYRFARGGISWLYTNSDTVQNYLTGQYVPEVIDRDEIDQSSEDTAGALTVTVPRDNDVAALFLPYLPIEPVSLTVYRKHRDDADTLPIFIGRVASAAFEGSEARLTALPISEIMRRPVPGLMFQVPCNHALYGPGCGANRELFKESGPILAVAGETIQCAAFASRPNGFFTAGFARLPDGDVRFIIAHAGNTITLMSPFPSAAPGQQITAYAGCDRLETTCDTKFGNLPNHMGFARIPTLNPYNTDISGMAGNGGSVLINPSPPSGPYLGGG